MGDHSRMLVLLVAACLGTGTGVHTARLHRRQLNFGQNKGGSDTGLQSPDTRVQSQDTGVQSSEFGEQVPGTRIFGLLGGLFGGGDDCVCVTDEDEERTERQVEVGQKFFFGGGGSDCNCPTDEGSGSGPTDETVRDCKERRGKVKVMRVLTQGFWILDVSGQPFWGDRPIRNFAQLKQNISYKIYVIYLK